MMNAKRVVLDPGHGGWETGISYEGVLEKDVNLAVCLKLRDELVAAGIVVVMTRETDVELTAAKRIEIANQAQADMFIEWHCDSLEDGTVAGVSLWVDPSGSDADVERNKIVFDVIGDVLSETTGQIMMGVYEEKDRVLAQVKVPAALIRGGFLSNREERARLVDPDFQNEQARGAAQGILQLLSPKR